MNTGDLAWCWAIKANYVDLLAKKVAAFFKTGRSIRRRLFPSRRRLLFFLVKQRNALLPGNVSFSCALSSCFDVLIILPVDLKIPGCLR